jgi:alanine racemase
MSEMSWLEIDLGKVVANLATLTSLTQRPFSPADPPRAKVAVCAVVKKNAYGLGAEAVAHALVRAGCEMLAVFSADEARALVQNAVASPILLLMPLRDLKRTDLLYRHAIDQKLHLSVHDLAQLRDLNSLGRTYGIRLPVHLYLDTGMSRSGLSAEQFASAVALLPGCTHLRLAGIFSHLATSDGDGEFALHQLDMFERVVAEQGEALPKDVVLHLANTCGILRDGRLHLDMVRPGLGLYGYGQEMLGPGPVIGDVPQLAHTVRWVSHINHVQRYARDTPVGYGSTHRLERESVLGIVPVGYGDGYPLALSNLASVRVLLEGGQPASADVRVLGRVNMDQLIVDLTDVASAADGQRELVGATVEVISGDPAAPNSVPRLAALAQSHPYEILCRLGGHLPRRYVR